jgi:hypothetical protein
MTASASQSLQNFISAAMKTAGDSQGYQVHGLAR